MSLKSSVGSNHPKEKKDQNTPQIEEACKKCEKPILLCLCSSIVQFKNKLKVLILQHPQEPDKVLGTARLTQLSLTQSALRVGLSWPNLFVAVTGEKNQTAEKQKGIIPQRWAVLFLGAQKKKVHLPREQLVGLFSKDFSTEEDVSILQGIIILDGTWAQAKTLWWRNPWLSKLKRVVLNPNQKSLYGQLRKEPRREALSTIEAAALVNKVFNGSDEVEQVLLKNFNVLLDKVKSSS